MKKSSQRNFGQRFNPNNNPAKAIPADEESPLKGTERLHSPRRALKTKAQIKVWDVLVRTFHWTLVTSFFTGFFITDKFPLHAYAGYLIFTLVLLRILWGFVGSPYARFSAFIYTVRETIQYTLSAFRMGPAREYLSHNPMGALMVFAFLFLLLGNTIVGTMLYAAQQLEGPLVDIVPVHWDETLEEIHKFIAKMLISLAGFHITGVVWASWWHRQNYVLAMFTGYKSVFTRRTHREEGSKVWTAEERAAHHH
ncbi:cytochrome b/b6 domain-containing protein [Azoarcus sp. KH32C]|uniref:cytochrome b/b6 domain-containing protein n=1 Tax=Azoarcus sp. KH32C TaxID=748247 RepID=UPI00023869AF|nr:cytochrome b/b6 domain-containing protein [Azoarcus sp. KH32C]BAL25931.1 putative cytochrome b561 [Azoarcus sp. KH32C]